MDLKLIQIHTSQIRHNWYSEQFEVLADRIDGVLHVRTGGLLLQEHIIVLSVLLRGDVLGQTPVLEADTGQIVAVIVDC